MAKRNYGTVQKKIADLAADITSKDGRGFFHNSVTSDDLFVLLDAILRRMPKDDRQVEVFRRWANSQTIGSLMNIEEVFGEVAKDFIIRVVRDTVDAKEGDDASKKS